MATGHKGGNDIWTARRAKATDPFGPPEILAELNSPTSDAVSWVSGDGCTVIVQGQRDAEGDDRVGYDLYQTTRSR